MKSELLESVELAMNGDRGDLAEVDLNGNPATMGSLSTGTGNPYTSTSLYKGVKLRTGILTELVGLAPQTIPQVFRESCQKFKDQPAMMYQEEKDSDEQQKSSDWTALSYEKLESRVEQVALMLMHVGLQPRSSVGVLALPCLEWLLTEYGTLLAGGVVAGIYPSNSAEAVYHALDVADATVCVVDDAQQMAKVCAIKYRLPRLGAVIQVHGPFEDFVGRDQGFYRWQDLERMPFGARLQAELWKRERSVLGNECAFLIYTSGTVGMPKAAMISHDAVICNSKSFLVRVRDHMQQNTGRIVSYLPLNHIAAQVIDIYMSLISGACVYFSDKNAMKGTLIATLRKARPTFFFGVPRIYEKMAEQLMGAELRLPALFRYLLQSSRALVEKKYLEQSSGGLMHWLALKIVHRFRSSLGFDECRLMLAGGAPISVEIQRYFLSLNLPLSLAYGLSESSGGVSLNLDWHNLGSTGQLLDGYELKIDNPNKEGHGEICILGRAIFMGYLKEPQKTTEAFTEDGWFRTGDLGYVDDKAGLVVSGRLKELIITSGGENIPPVHIEHMVMKELPCLSNAMLIGDFRKYLTILLTLKTECDPATGMPTDALSIETKDWVQTLGLKFTRLSEVLNIPEDIHNLDAAKIKVNVNNVVSEAIHAGIQRANLNAISNAQRIQKFSILPHGFSIPTGELGPTLKVRRNIVTKKYSNIIESMYD